MTLSYSFSVKRFGRIGYLNMELMKLNHVYKLNGNKHCINKLYTSACKLFYFVATLYDCEGFD